MNFEYVANINFILSGNSLIGLFYLNDFKYSVGQTVCLKNKAQIGKLEKITIKKTNRVYSEQPSYEGIQPVLNYVDTFNAIYLEEELCTYEEAIALI